MDKAFRSLAVWVQGKLCICGMKDFSIINKESLPAASPFIEVQKTNNDIKLLTFFDKKYIIKYVILGVMDKNTPIKRDKILQFSQSTLKPGAHPEGPKPKVEQIVAKDACSIKPDLKDIKKILIDAHQANGSPRSLLDFRLVKEGSGLQKSFNDLFAIANTLDSEANQSYDGCQSKLSCSDIALIELTMNIKFKPEERLKAFQAIKSLDAKLELESLQECLKKSLVPSFKKMKKQLEWDRDVLKETYLDLMSAEKFSSILVLYLLARKNTYKELFKAIQDYHAIPKTDKQTLNSRIACLLSIAEIAKSISQNIPQGENTEGSELQNLQTGELEIIERKAQQKANYLRKISKLKQEAYARAHILANSKYLAESAKVINVGVDPLRNIDPAKRSGIGYFYEKWNEELKKDPKIPNFWLWLEDKDSLLVEKGIFQMSKYGSPDKKQKEVSFKDGLAYNQLFGREGDGLLEGKFLYNIGQNGNLYILSPSFGKSAMTHDVVLKGKNILSAGIVHFIEGKMSYIDVSSGHYLPSRFQDLKPALVHFLNKNPEAIISPDTRIGFYESSNARHYTYEEFMETNNGQDREIPRERFTLEHFGFKSKKPSSLT